MSEKHKFCPLTHEIVSFDVTKLFPSVNVKRVIGCIMKHYSISPEFFFNFQNFEGEKLPPPPKAKFREFLEGVLPKFNVFECLTGIYRQKNGLPMGSSLSPLLANLYVSMMEASVIKGLIKSGKVVTWIRYADDVFAIIRKRSSKTVLEKINSWDGPLHFTLEEMKEN